MTQVAEKKTLLMMPIYVCIGDNTQVLPSAELKFIRPSEFKDLPPGKTFYLITGGGSYLHKDTGLIQATVPVDSIGGLHQGFEADCSLRMPKIPSLIIARALVFFRKIWDAMKSEAEVMLLYNEKDRRYELHCPTQEVNGGHVDYKLSDQMIAAKAEMGDGWKIVGTIHSHCNFSAFHSGTDTHDEANQDGIHITLGHVPQKNFSCTSAVAVNGHRWNVPPANVVKGILNKTEEEADSRTFVSTHSSDDFYNLRLTAAEQGQLQTQYATQIENEWCKRVKAKNYGGHHG